MHDRRRRGRASSQFDRGDVVGGAEVVAKQHARAERSAPRRGHSASARSAAQQRRRVRDHSGFDFKADIDGRRRVRQRADRDEVGAGGRELGMRSSVTPPEISTLRAPAGTARPPRGSSSTRHVVGAGRCRRRRLDAHRRPLLDALRLDLDAADQGDARVRRRPLRATPPASLMWLSLIRIASKSPIRWLAPPPAHRVHFRASAASASSCACRG